MENMVLTNKNILVTGGTGFIGSHLVEKLIELESNIVVLHQSTNPKSYFWTSQLNKNVILTACDLKNFKKIYEIICKYEIDYIFHLGAQSIVTVAYDNPLETFETNIVGTVNVLEAARVYGRISGILVTSSDKAYGKIPKASEKDPIGGNHPYESSKASADLIAETYYKTYKLPVVITRFGNVYGEGDLNFSRIMPGIMKSIIKKEDLEIRSNGKYVRDYVYVDDIISAVITLVKNIKKTKGEAFNISSKENLSVLGVIHKIEKILNKKVHYKILNIAVNEISKQSIDFNKIKKSLSWKPKNRIKMKISDIYNWYVDYFNRNS